MSDLFQLPDPGATGRLLTALQRDGALAVAVVGERTEERRYLDSFDWRLHNAGRSLCVNGGFLQLENLQDGDVRVSAPAPAAETPRFARDLPAGPLRDQVARRLRVRALVQQASVSADVRILEVRNGTGSVVARLEESTWRPETSGTSRPALATLTLRAVPGERGALKRVRRHCRDAGLVPATTPPPTWSFEAAGLEPGSYRSKPHVSLAADLEARGAVRLICRQLLATMLQNEEGVRADWDTEFLHDFRVATRRTRVLLGQAKGIFAAGELDRFRQGLRVVGRRTGPLRDLDVHLLDEHRYRDLVPEPLRPGVHALFARLRGERNVVLASTRAFLNGGEYGELIRRWSDWLATEDPAGASEPNGDGAPETAADFACRRILRQHRRILKRGARIHDESPAFAFHSLRIEGKKLRYLLELFADLFPADEIEELVGRLRKLQDILGAFNDLHTQRQRLRSDLAALPPRAPTAIAEAAAIGALLAVLTDRQREACRGFSAAHRAFARKSVTRRFARLCAGRR